MSVLIRDMKMPKRCHDCRWFYFEGMSCTTPQYLLDARCELVPSGQDWYGKDKRGGWVGESIEHIPGWSGRYPYKHCVELGTRAKQCPLVELPEKHGRLVDADAVFDWYIKAFNSYPKIEPNEVRFSMNDIAGNLLNMPTIIEAEGDEE